MKRWMQAALMAACITPALVECANAQTVRGVARSGSANQPTGGAVILFADTANTVVARTLTTSSGGYQVRLPAPGRYELRVLRIGFQPFVLQFGIAGDTTINLNVINIPAALATVTVEDSRQCRVRSDEARATFQLWDEVAKALLAAQITRERRGYTFAAQHSRRIFEGDVLRAAELADRHSDGLEPWTSLHPDSLARTGYISEADGAINFIAPDIDVLLSRSFVMSHCLRLAPFKRDAKTISIEFEPVDGIRRPDIKGSLTVDRSTRELRTLDYSYTRAPFKDNFGFRAQGHVEFLRLPDGGWITPRWAIGVPIPERGPPGAGATSRQANAGLGPRRVSGLVQVSGADLRAVHVREGADSTQVWRAKATPLTVEVRTADDKPAAGALVRIVGSSSALNADAAGRARFEQVLPGYYMIDATTSDLLALGSSAKPVEVSLKIDRAGIAKVKLPSIANIVREKCGRPLPEQGAGIITGYVFRDGRALEGVPVTAKWITDPGAEVPRQVLRDQRTRDTTDGSVVRTAGAIEMTGRTTTRADGRYTLCGVSTKHSLTLSAAADSGRASESVRATAGQIVITRNLELRR